MFCLIFIIMVFVIVVWFYFLRFVWEFNVGGLFLWFLLFRFLRKEVVVCEGFVLKDYFK